MDKTEKLRQLQKEMEFRKELTSLLNRFSMKNGSNTPDFILADYLINCLDTFNDTNYQRENWYGRLKDHGKLMDP